MLGVLFSLLAFAPIATPVLPAGPYYVATTGNDTTGNGTQAFPFASVDGARKAIQYGKSNQGLAADLNVLIAPGTYPSVAFSQFDSGSNGHAVVYQAQNGPGTVTISGGTTVSGCVVSSGAIYKCPVTGSFWAVWENGVRLTSARTPNYSFDPLFPNALGPYFRTTGTNGSYTAMNYSGGDITPAAWPVGDIQVVAWTGGNWNWFPNVNPLTSQTSGSLLFTFTNQSQWPIFQNATGSRYFVQGVQALLDANGEWYHDQSGNFLYVQSTTGGAPGTLTIPTTGRVIAAVGTTSAHVHDLKFKDLTVQYADYAQWDRYADWGISTDHPTAGAGHTCPGYTFEKFNTQNHQALVYLENADNVTVTTSHLLNGGFGGVHAFRTTGVTISDNWIEQTGADGVVFEGDWAGEGDFSNHNTATGNVISNVGQLGSHAVGVRMLGSNNNSIDHNEVWGANRDAIFTVGGCGVFAQNYTFSNTIDRNYFHDILQDSGDAGAVGFYLLASTSGSPPYATNTVSNTLVDHVYASPAMTDAAPNGVFTDNSTAGQAFSNVGVFNTQDTAMRINSGGGSGSHTATNCTFNADATTNGSFDVTLLDLANIGVPSANPYRSSAGYSLSEDFESGLGRWTTGQGTPALSTAQAHSPTHSFVQNQDGEAIYLLPGRVLRQKACAWLFDDATDTTAEALLKADEMTYSAGTFTTWNNTAWRALGVYTPTSTTKYVYRIGGATTATSITRTTGWHQFCVDYSGRAGAAFSIDGTSVGTVSTGVLQFNVLALGDFTAGDGNNANVYWDDVTIN